MIHVLTLALLLTACGTKTAFKDPETTEIAERFEQEARKRSPGDSVRLLDTSSIEIKVSPDETSMESGTVARCSGIHSKRILINRKFWTNASWIKREMIVFHELGHCALGRPHSYDLDPKTKYPKSLMHEVLPSERLYTQDRERYLDELFNFDRK